MKELENAINLLEYTGSYGNPSPDECFGTANQLRQLDNMLSAEVLPHPKLPMPTKTLQIILEDINIRLNIIKKQRDILRGHVDEIEGIISNLDESAESLEIGLAEFTSAVEKLSENL